MSDKFVARCKWETKEHICELYSSEDYIEYCCGGLCPDEEVIYVQESD